MLPDQDTISVLQHLDLPESNIFMIDNTSFEEIDFEMIFKTIPNYNIAIKRAILDQQKSFNYNKENINVLLQACEKFGAFDTDLIKPIYTTNKKLLSSIESFVNIKNRLTNEINPQIIRLNEQLDIATSKSNEYSNYTVTTSFIYQDFETRENEYRTICSECDENELTGCHDPCDCVAFNGDIGRCQIFSKSKNEGMCQECGHKIEYHCHSKQFAVKIEKTESKLDESRKNTYLEAQNDIRKLSWEINNSKTLRIALTQSMWNQVKSVADFAREMNRLQPIKLTNDYINEHIKQCINGMRKAEIDAKTNTNTGQDVENKNENEKLNKNETKNTKKNEKEKEKEKDLEKKNDENKNENKNDETHRIGKADHDQDNVELRIKRIDNYQQLSEVYTIRNNFCTFFSAFSNDTQIMDSLTMISNSNGNINIVIRDVMTAFSQVYFGSLDEKEEKTDKDLEIKTDTEAKTGRDNKNYNDQLSFMQRWNKLWMKHKEKYSVIQRVMEFLVNSASFNSNSDDDDYSARGIGMELFSCTDIKQCIIDVITAIRDIVDRTYPEIGNDSVVGDMCSIAVKSIQVEWSV